MISGTKAFSRYYPQITVDEQPNFMWRAARLVRNKSQEMYHKPLPPISASLLMGIVFGVKEQYPQEFLQDLRAVGVLHVIEASGMNVSFVAGAIMFSLGSFF